MTWISVKDKLPALLEKVLFIYIIDEVLVNIAVGYLQKEGWDIYLPYRSFELSNIYVEVTHWMPLLDYPKDDKDDAEQKD